MALIDLALTAADVNKEAASEGETPKAEAAETPKYPWGLSIYLDEVVLGKLKMDPMSFKPGTELGFDARATVTGANINQTADGEMHCTVSLQITAMDFSDDGDEDDKPTAAEAMAGALFGKK